MITDLEHPVSIDELLIVTFTRAAAGEMRERIRLAIEARIEEEEKQENSPKKDQMLEHLRKQNTLLHHALITTIDSFCAYIVRNYFHLIDLDPSFRVGEEGELRMLQGDVAERILSEAYEEGSEETRKRFAKNLKKAVEMAAAKGIVLGFETMETPFMNTVQKSMKYVNLVDSLYLNVYPDLGNITNAAKAEGGDVLKDLETGRGRLAAMHLKETVPGKFREIPFGTGHVDFESSIRKAWELGVRRYVTEFWYTGSPAWKEDIDFAVKMMTEILDRQTV